MKIHKGDIVKLKGDFGKMAYWKVLATFPENRLSEDRIDATPLKGSENYTGKGIGIPIDMVESVILSDYCDCGELVSKCQCGEELNR